MLELGSRRDPTSKEVRRFLQQRKATGGGEYKVYNLTTERPPYSESKLGGSLASYGFDDHQVPSLQQMVAFCIDLDHFLSLHPQNFAAVHCKAGKGRTGVMICAYILHKRFVTNSEEALETYARQRSNSCSGITVPSQQRYVRYFEAVVAEQEVALPSAFALHAISVSGLPSRQLSELVVVISQRCPLRGKMEQVTELTASQASVRKQQATRYTEAAVIAELRPAAKLRNDVQQEDCILEGDIRVEVYRGRSDKQHNLLLRTWFNTAFVSVGSYTLRDWELDKGCAPVRPGTVLRLQLGEAASGQTNERQQPLQVLLEDSARGLQGVTIPAVQSGSGKPDMLEQMREQLAGLKTGYPPNPFAAESQLQLPPSPAASLTKANSSSPVRELAERLEALATRGMAEGDQLPRITADRRSRSTPVSFLKSFDLKQACHRPLEVLSAVQTRQASGSAQETPQAKKAKRQSEQQLACRSEESEDPEWQDISAPTTPSPPRPLDTFDWQAPASCLLTTSHSLDPRYFPAEVADFREGTASGPDSPSHGARIIKWMSSSWWLDMA